MDKELDYFSNIDLSDELNNELEIALEKAEKQLFND